jgi:LysR family transcriptional regulator of gallate degradation
LAGHQRLAWTDLAAADWIMPMPHTPAQAAFEQALAAAGLALPPSPLRVNSALMMQTLLAETDRLALMSPRQVQRELRAGLLVELPVQVVHQPRPIGMVWRADYLPPPGAALLMAQFRALGLSLREAG